MNKIDLSIIIPAYQEADNILFLAPKLISTLDNLNINYEILVVDTTNKMDNTHDICSKYSFKY